VFAILLNRIIVTTLVENYITTKTLLIHLRTLKRKTTPPLHSSLCSLYTSTPKHNIAMSAAPLVALILGAGPRVGYAVAKSFASKGYKVAVAARSLNESESTPEQLNIKSDFSKPSQVVSAFERVKKELGTPNVVVYNGMSGASQFLAREKG
jgi:hypothetical protein